jgi:hypothetical protein
MIPPLLALFSYPVVVAILFARLKPVTALIVAIVAGYLLLPHGRGLNLPVLPTLDKHSIPALSALVAMALVLNKTRQKDPRFLEGWWPRSPLAVLFIALILFGTLATTLTNGDRLSFGPLTLPAMRPYDAGAFLLLAAMMLVPFFLARRFLGHPDTHPILLFLLVLAGLAYSFFAIYEARMSPQININVYGYFQHIWIQHLRAGGFRPIVFLQHGLWVSLFFSTALLSALALYRGKKGAPRLRYLYAAGWLFVTLVLTKSLGALIITVALAPIILLLSVRLQLIMAALVAVVVMTYPVLRGAGVVPIDAISERVETINPARADSLRYRLNNEEILLERAQQRPLFGWGGWGRNSIYNEYGRNIAVTDGFWVIIIGQRGWVGYVGIFGLLSVGILGLVWQARRLEITPATAGLAVVLAGNMVDLIPNAGITVLTWMMAGALLGRLEHGRISDTAVAAAPEAARRTLRYSRFGAGPATASAPAASQAAPEPDTSTPAFARTAEARGPSHRRAVPAPDTASGAEAGPRARKGRHTRFEERHGSS